MSRLADFGLTITADAKKRWLIRRGTPVAITPLQRDMLEWLDVTGTPTLGCCCDTLWEQVDEKWVRGQWDKLGTVMLPLGVIAAIDDADAIGLHTVDAEGCPVARALNEKPEVVFQAGEGEPSDTADRLRWLEERLNAAEAEVEEFRRERNHHRHCEQEALREIEKLQAQVAEYRDAAAGQLVIVNQAKEALAERDVLRMQVAERDLELVKIRQLNDGLASEAQDRLERLLKAEEEIARLKEMSTQPLAEVVQLRDYPVRLAPRYLTVAVSEPLFRWLEASGDHNRRSADDMARALLLAFMRSTGNREAA